MSYGQTTQSCGPPERIDSSLVGVKGNVQLPKKREWEFIPSLCVSERYDSNVSFSGGSNHDYVTHVSPKVLIRHSGEYVSGTLETTGFNETYVRNSGLNFFGGGGTLALTFDKAIRRLLPHASLGITESARYTPLPPGFLNPIAGTSPSDPVNPEDAFARGILGFRANNFSNNAGVNFSYVTSPSTQVDLGYSNAIIRYGSSDLTKNSTLPLFDITTHTGTAGGSFSVTANDKLNARYSFSDSTFIAATTFAAGGASTVSIDRSFQSHSMLVGWSRIWTPYLKSELGGGGVVITPGLTSWAMDAALVLTIPDYPVTLSYKRSAFPSVFGQGVPVIGNMVSLTAIQRLSYDWQLVESANFSRNDGANDDQSSVRFTTYRGAIDLHYWITRIWSAALSYEYMRFNTEIGGGPSLQFDRHTATLGVKATWE